VFPQPWAAVYEISIPKRAVRSSFQRLEAANRRPLLGQPSVFLTDSVEPGGAQLRRSSRHGIVKIGAAMREQWPSASCVLAYGDYHNFSPARSE
jgi:hypothetical protein